MIRDVITDSSMGNNKKDFLYNPSWRISVYSIAGIFIFCFKIFVLMHPKMERHITMFETGQNSSAAVIGSMSSSLLTLVLIVFTYKNLSLSLGTILSFLMIYVLLSLTGYFSLLRFRDYQQENK